MSQLLSQDKIHRGETLSTHKELDTSLEAAFHHITKLATQLFDVPTALIAWKNRGNQWFDSCCGADAFPNGHDLSLFTEACANHTVLVVPDATQEIGFTSHPLVTGAPNIRFFAGAPLRTATGIHIGALCLFDTVAREFSAQQQEMLASLAQLAVDEWELRVAARHLQQESARRLEAEEAYAQLAFFPEVDPNPIIEIDLSGALLYLNPAAAQAFPDLATQSVQHPLLADGESWQKILSNGRRSMVREAEVGQARWQQVITHIPNSKRIRFYCLDVSDRKRAEERLAELASIVESSDDAIVSKTLEGTIVSWNPGAERIYGYTAQEAIGQSVSMLVPPDRADEVAQILARIRRGEYIDHFETKRVRKDRRCIDLSLTISPIRNADGIVTGASTIARDISERKAAEAKQAQLATQVEQERHHLHEILAHVPGVVFEASGHSGEMQVVFVNDYVETMLGYSVGEWLRKPGMLTDIVHPDDQARIREESAKTLANGNEGVSEYRGIAKDGHTVWIETHYAYIRNEQGAPVGVRGVSMDITERKQTESAIRYAMREAEKAKEEAEKANRAKSEFLSRMSHELRTPLNAILGFAQVLEMDDLTPTHASNVHHILKGGQHLLQLINEILDISRIEAGQMTLSTEPVLVSDIVGEAMDMVQPLADHRRVRLSLRTPCEAFVLADRQRCKQVLLNLLSNAIKYNREGGEVTIDCTATTLDTVALAVHDTGLGIAPDKMEKLFQPFERLGAEHGSVEGTGIGLALSKRLAELMGGSITAKSVPGDGSTFCFTLPRTDSPLAMATDLCNGAGPLVADEASAAIWSLLYIEDNLPNLQLIEQILLRRPDIHLISAMQGSVGLDLAQQHQPDLILLDLHLPDMHGDRVLQQLKENAATQDIPVIIISADATPREIERLKRAGAAAYVTKPLDIKHFLAIIDANLPL